MKEMTSSISNLPDDVFTAKTIGLLLTKIDHDLAANIVFAGISLSSKKLIDIIQACLIVSAQREFEASCSQTAEKAEKIVEKAMSEFADRLQKSVAK